VLEFEGKPVVSLFKELKDDLFKFFDGSKPRFARNRLRYRLIFSTGFSSGACGGKYTG